MSLNTHSKFYFGFEVDSDNLYLDFKEGGPELTAQIAIGSYTMTDFAAAIQSAMNAESSNNYVVSIDRTTRIVTIAGDAAFDLLVTTGSHAGSSIFGELGFTGADLVGLATYSGATAIGTEYSTQFVLQSFVDADDQQNATYGTVNKAASGKIEVVTYGNESYFDMEFKFITNIDNGLDGPIRFKADGVDQFRNFMRYLVTKAPLEFMRDENDPSSFENIYLEGTPEDASMGLKFKIKEQYGRGLPGYFESGVLKFRKIED